MSRAALLYVINPAEKVIMTETITRTIFTERMELAKRFADPAVAGGFVFGFALMSMLLLSCSS